MTWKSLINWLPWRCPRLPVPELDAALRANVEAHRGVAREEARLGDKLAIQQHRTEEMLDQIRARASKGGATSPALVAIAHTLKSLETRP